MLPIIWERSFHKATDANGATVYTDKATGEQFPTLPNLHHADGRPV